MVNIDPNIAYRDRNEKPKTYKRPAHITFVSSHLVHFSCPGCSHKYAIKFYKGMTLHTNSLLCPSCKGAQMKYHIDT